MPARPAEGEEDMRKLYRYRLSCGRAGSVVGLFVADDEQDIKPAIGKTAQFGEILGKHSEVEAEIVEKDLTVLTSDADFIAKFERYGCGNGYNPLDYISCSDCGEALSAPYEKCDAEWCKRQKATKA
jgi:hypothetical protein